MLGQGVKSMTSSEETVAKTYLKPAPMMQAGASTIMVWKRFGILFVPHLLKIFIYNTNQFPKLFCA
jgi:hypothetical protein